MTKFNCFLQISEILNDKFNIVPLLYGSLGLEVLTNSSLNADDIDILISEVCLIKNVLSGNYTKSTLHFNIETKRFLSSCHFIPI